MRSKLREGEQLIYVARKHWVVLLKPLVLILLFVVLSVVFFTPLFLVGATLLIAYFVYCIYDRKYNIWIVTNRRVIDEWGVLSHKFKESPIEKINNVNVIQDVAGRIFDYGSVEIQTAAEQGTTVATMVQTPRKLQDAIIYASSKITSEVNDLVECYYCAELIKKNAKVCRYCGRETVNERKIQVSNIYNERENTNMHGDEDDTSKLKLTRRVNIEMQWRKDNIKNIDKQEV